MSTINELKMVSADRFMILEDLDYSVVEKLSDLPGLKTIQLHEFKPNEHTLRLLNEVLFSRRKDITLRVYSYPDFWSDISILNSLPELERFDWETKVFGSIEPLYRLKKLVHIGLGYTQPKPKISLKWLTDFKDSLESIRLEGDFKDFLTTIPQLVNLKTFWIKSMKLEGFDFLEGLAIETIGNYGSRVGSFEFLANLKSIKKIWIKTNTKIQDIDFISELPNLEEIELLYVRNVTRFPKCDHLRHLKRIFAFECNGLTDIDEAKKLKHCRVSLSGKQIPRHYLFEPTLD